MGESDTGRKRESRRLKRQIIAIGGAALPAELDNLLLVRYFLEQTGKRKPQVAFIGMAGGDSETDRAGMLEDTASEDDPLKYLDCSIEIETMLHEIKNQRLEPQLNLVKRLFVPVAALADQQIHRE